MAFIFTDQNYQAEATSGAVVVDFYADWCGPCKMMAPVFEELAGEYDGRVRLGKMNVDENPETPGRFGVSGIPTIVFLKDGAEVGRLVGFQSKEAFQSKINELFSNP